MLHAPKYEPAPEKSQKKKGQTALNLFQAKQEERLEWDRQYKKVAPEIRDDWAELNPRP